MIPIVLGGHEKPITDLKLSHHGDLLFSSSKDGVPMAWYTENGERLGTYEGHEGVVWSLDITKDTQHLITGSADRSVKIWNALTGEVYDTLTFGHVVKSVGWSLGHQMFFASVRGISKNLPTLFIYECKDLGPNVQCILKRKIDLETDVDVACWGYMNETILCGGTNGYIYQYSVETGEIIKSIAAHKGVIKDLKFNADFSFFMTASADKSSKLFDGVALEHLKTYEASQPVNACHISPIMLQVIVGGGQEAIQVTTTRHQLGHFNVSFHDLVYEHELAQLKGHFGPIHALTYFPDGMGYVSGSEDGNIRILRFPRSYFETQLLPPSERHQYDFNLDEKF